MKSRNCDEYNKNDNKYRFDFSLKGLDKANQNDEKHEYAEHATQEDMDLEDQMLAKMSEDKSSKVDMRMTITEVQEDKYCVQFNKMEGDHVSYNKAYDFLTKDVLRFAVDDVYTFTS